MRRLLAIGLCCIITNVTASAQSQEPATSVGDPVTATLAVPDTATLLVANRPVVTFRSSFGAANATERVERAGARIAQVAEADAAGAVTLLRIPQGSLVRVGGQGIFTVTPADIDSSSAQTIEQVAADAMLALRVAMAEEREARSFIQILTGVALAAVVPHDQWYAAPARTTTAGAPAI